MKLRFFKTSIGIVTLVVLLFVGSRTFVKSEENLDVICQWDNIAPQENILSRLEFQSLLEKCKVFFEQKSDQLGKEITKTDQEKKTLAEKIKNLQNQIAKLNSQISQGNIMVKDLSLQIYSTQGSIDQTSQKIDDVKGKLINLLQARYEEDRKSTVEILLEEESMASFFDNLVALEMLNTRTNDLLHNIKNLKTDLESQKTVMDNERQDLQSVVVAQTLQQQDSAKKRKEQEQVLKLTEQEYQQYLKEQQQAKDTAAKIGNKLFQLLEVPEGGIKFEDAVAIAKSVGQDTGIRPAFSLAILWQETRIGQLQGGCYLKNTKTGDGTFIKTGNAAPKTMNPTRDVPLFLNIIQKLSSATFIRTDAFSTPVSCCMIKNGTYFGWGGAMGPAQFIASTWMIYNDQIEKKTGRSPANPWNVQDAFLANALYLSDLGAGAKTYSKEMNAALRYFGCTTAWCQTTYGEPVMEVAECLQDYIDKGSMSNDCQNLIF